MPKKEKRGFYLIFYCLGKKYRDAYIASGIKCLIQHTGSGKTIIMTALFEAILTEPDEELAWPLDWQAQADAVI